MIFDPFALAAIVLLILLLPFMLFILAHIARRSGQDEWDRAEQARHRRPPKRPYTQRYVDALDGEPGPCRLRWHTSRSKRSKRIRPLAVRRGVVADDYAVMSVVSGDARGKQARLALLGAKNSLIKMPDRSGRLGSLHTGGKKAKRGAKIDELWFDRV